MFYRKLNKKFVVDHYTKKGKKIEYGMDTPMGFMGIQYSYVHTTSDEELLRVVPAKAIVFSTNDLYQGFFRKLSETPDGQKLHPNYAFFAGGFAGMTASASTYPLDFARVSLNSSFFDDEFPALYHQ